MGGGKNVKPIFENMLKYETDKLKSKSTETDAKQTTNDTKKLLIERY